MREALIPEKKSTAKYLGGTLDGRMLTVRSDEKIVSRVENLG